MRSAQLSDERFEPREGFDPSYLRNPRVARLLHSPAVARWKLERGAQPLTDGSAIANVPYKTEDWLLSEVLADRGETVVLEPLRLRDVVARASAKAAARARSASPPSVRNSAPEPQQNGSESARSLVVRLRRRYVGCHICQRRTPTSTTVSGAPAMQPTPRCALGRAARRVHWECAASSSLDRRGARWSGVARKPCSTRRIFHRS